MMAPGRNGGGQNSDVTAEAADVVAMENSLKKVDEFMHISRRMRSLPCKARSAEWC